jgi:nicotinic acid mononucleotide adenylyltransferase
MDMFPSVIPKLLARPLSLYLVATGAGAGVQDVLWKVPGCSSFFRGASFPYDPRESIAFAGLTPKKFASPDFAFDLAFAAYMRAIDLEHPGKEPVGLAVTASVASIREHRGDHQAHVVCITRDKISSSSMMLEKGAGPHDRIVDGNLVDTLVVSTFLHALGYTVDKTDRTSSLDEEARNQFFKNPVFWPDGRRTSEDQLDTTWPLFPGAFNPVHQGHESIADTFDDEPVFTIDSKPPHKAPLTVQEMLLRAKMLGHRTTYFTEGDSLYIDKARRHPGTPIILGADALLRMLDPKWGIDPESLLNEFCGLGTTLMVFGREVNGKFVTAEEAINAAPIDATRRAKLFRAIEGRWDISSTALRLQSQSPTDRIRVSVGDVATRSAAPAETTG